MKCPVLVRVSCDAKSHSEKTHRRLSCFKIHQYGENLSDATSALLKQAPDLWASLYDFHIKISGCFQRWLHPFSGGGGSAVDSGFDIMWGGSAVDSRFDIMTAGELRKTLSDKVQQNNKSTQICWFQDFKNIPMLHPKKLSKPFELIFKGNPWTLIKDCVFNQVNWTNSSVETAYRCGNSYRWH